MTGQASKHRMLIMIDMLLDTQISCVKKVNPDWVVKLIENGYHKRVTNTFSYLLEEIDNVKVKEIWKNRDKDILMDSRSTNLLQLLSIERKQLIGILDTDPRYIDLNVTLNIFPYKLNEEERIEFQELLKGYLQTDNVSVIYKDIKQMSPYWIHSNYDQILIYDINEWLGLHMDALKNYKIPLVIFTFPLILLEEVNPIGKNPKDIINQMNTLFIGILKADIIPLHDVSLFYTPNIEE